MLRWIGMALAVAAVVVTGLVAGRGSHPRSAGLTAPTTTLPPAPLAPAPAGPPAKGYPSAPLLGVSVNRLFNDRAYSRPQIDAQLRALQATGATTARSDALWETIETRSPSGDAHHYAWSFDDLIAASLAAHGLRWLPILDYTPAWAESVPGEEHSAPLDARDFAAFARAFAARYGAGGGFWREHASLPALPVSTYEIWNEPDNRSFWVPVPDPGRYAELYLRARDAIDSVDSSARVIVGGLAHPESFLPALIKARPDLGAHLDGVGIHPYGPTPSVVLDRVHTARQTLDSLGLSSVPLYVTEFGWSTLPQGNPAWASEQTRPGYISATFVALGHTDCGVAAAILYSWVTPQGNPENREDWFGIHPPSGGNSLDETAFSAGLRGARAPGPKVTLCGGR